MVSYRDEVLEIGTVEINPPILRATCCERAQRRAVDWIEYVDGVLIRGLRPRFEAREVAVRAEEQLVLQRTCFELPGQIRLQRIILPACVDDEETPVEGSTVGGQPEWIRLRWRLVGIRETRQGAERPVIIEVMIDGRLDS